MLPNVTHAWRAISDLLVYTARSSVPSRYKPNAVLGSSDEVNQPSVRKWGYHFFGTPPTPIPLLKNTLKGERWERNAEYVPPD
ncbi:MAG TPA: hypothetical protein VGO47_02860 [Chlamydiales bacterium]|nr:hypothetical protein [Chlamydiales bacterium]